MSKCQNDIDKDKLIKRIDELNEFGHLEDGYVYYFPRGGGALDAVSLRIIADELDRRNKPWDDEIKAYFDKETE